MRARVMVVVISAVAAVVGLVAGCKDSRYCDEKTQCNDPAYPYCRMDWHECEATPPDGGGLDAGGDAARVDGRADAGSDAVVGDGASDGPQAEDGGGDANHDAGCPTPTRQCPTGCFENDIYHCGASCVECTSPSNGHATCNGTSCDFTCDNGYWKDGTGCTICDTQAHCGALCGACSGGTPDCVGGNTGKCECNAGSCSGTTPVCDGTTKACRACTSHSECASGACDLVSGGGTGGCVAAADIIYVDQNNVACSNGVCGSLAVPCCNFENGLAAVTGTRFHLVVRAGTYQYNAAQVVQDKKVVVIGANSSATPTELVQNHPGTPVVQVVQVSGTAELSLYGLTLRGASNSGGHGVQCTSVSTPAVLSVESCEISSNGGVGVNATQCTVTATQLMVQQNASGGIALAGSDFVIENCLVAGNGSTGSSCTASNSVGGVRVSGNGTAAADRFVNNTVADNNCCNTISPGVQCESGTTVDVRNSIVWANVTGAGDPQLGGSGCTTTNSWVQGVSGATDPYFKGGSPFDYHLQTNPPDAHTSPCIGAGTSVGAPAIDLDGNPRGNPPAIGCYEAQ